MARARALTRLDDAMQAFVELCMALEASARPEEKREALRRYFTNAGENDAAWAAYFLTGHRLGARVRRADVRAAALASAGIPEWLLAASHAVVEDFAETVSLVTHGHPTLDAPLATWVETRLLPLAGLAQAESRARLVTLLGELDRDGRFLAVKLLLGTFRAAVPRDLVHAVLATLAGVPRAVVAHRLRDMRPPMPGFWHALRKTKDEPHAFAPVRALAQPPSHLGSRVQWQAEWMWPGTRAHLSVAPDAVTLWSAEDESLTERFPALMRAVRDLPAGTILDGVIVAWDRERDRPAEAGTAAVKESSAAVMIAFDVLQLAHDDVRTLPLAQRRAALESLVAHSDLVRVAPTVDASTWEELAQAREQCRAVGARGIVLKRLDAPYASDLSEPTWWSWPMEPYRVLGVLAYAEPGSGERGSLLASYTFALRHGEALVSFGSTTAGLDADEARALDRWIRANTLERFGPVRRVEPTQVFELALQAVAASKRHKSGLVVRGLRVLKWRKDVDAGGADTLDMVRAWAIADKSGA